MATAAILDFERYVLRARFLKKRLKVWIPNYQKNSLFTVKIDFIQKNLKYHRLKTIKYKINKSHVKV